MFRYKFHDDIDFALWDECINTSREGIIYALSWYLNITTPGWDGIVREANGKYEAVMPIPKFKKLGIPYIQQPILSQQLGLFYSDPLQRGSNDINELAKLILSKFKFIQRYEFNTENKQILKKGLPGFNQTTFTTHHIDLSQSYEEIVKKYRPDKKWRINKARRANLTVVRSVDIDTFIKIFHENVASKMYGIKGEKYEYKVLRNLYVETKKRALNTLLATVDPMGKILAMGMFFHYNHKIIYIFNASTNEGKKLSAISLVIDYMLKHYASKPLYFDFESPEIPNIAEFYRRFGSEPTCYASISLDKLPLLVKVLKKIRYNTYRTFIAPKKGSNYESLQ